MVIFLLHIMSTGRSKTKILNIGYPAKLNANNLPTNGDII